VIAPLQRVYEGWDFDEHVYEAMFQRSFLYASVIGHTVVLQQPTMTELSARPSTQQDWIASKRHQD